MMLNDERTKRILMHQLLCKFQPISGWHVMASVVPEVKRDDAGQRASCAEGDRMMPDAVAPTRSSGPLVHGHAFRS